MQGLQEEGMCREMTLILIFGVILLAGIVFTVAAIKTDRDLIIIIAIALMIFGIPGSIASTIGYIPSHRSSEIEYMQLIQEKQAIEQMIDSGEAVDKLTLNQRVIDYNNEIIEKQENYKRPIIKDYYSPNVDWEALELIEWK